ncbi:YbhN family protein [Halobaculum sp. MBLA0147]|uniref:lysylphosphatidylglycerol synthase transmembrane domain-containing protein n=1 Tax=Halobaculum sp. MBLA0147 TaxID=3079934 RepID=UPI00352610DC
MNGDQLRATVLGFLAAGGVLGVLVYSLDVGELTANLVRAEPPVLALVVGAILLWLLAWGFALRTVLGVLGVDIPPHLAFFVFNGAMFANNVTPFGQAGGEPVTALLISAVTDTEYERSLAAIASVDTLNFFPSIAFALLGAAYYATQATFGRRLRVATGIAVVLAVAVPVVGYLGWRNRDRLRGFVTGRLTPLVQRVARLVPGVSEPSTDTVEHRVDHFLGAIERVATDPRGLVIALSASTLGWLCQMVGLWLAFRALDTPVDITVVMFAVPMGAIAGATPTPGGSGFIESVLTGLLVVVLTVPQATVGAAVILFRAAVFGVPVLLGGLVVSWIGVDVYGQ